jgi:2-aminoethylphosphonate-pyruvate transaminase
MHPPERMRLLNPGPVTLSPRVRAAMQRPDLCHREPEYAALQNAVRARLAAVYAEAAAAYEAVLLTGSGTAAVEAMLASLVPDGGKALVVANGVYGERIATILAAHGKPHDVVRAAWTAPMDVAAARDKLAAGGFTHVVAVHHETTTGRLNDLDALGALCRAHNVALLLDAVSSFGGERLNFAGWNVEACAATANKCLHGVPGVAFVLARSAVFDTRASAARSLTLDLFRHRAEQRKGYPAFTPAVQSMFALHEALAELEDQGGWQRRNHHYRRLSALLRDGLQRLGVRLLLGRESDYASMLSSLLLPEGVPFGLLFDALKQAGFVIYPGQLGLQESIFRVAVMGDLTAADIEELLATFAAVLRPCPTVELVGR